jgi:peroxiredoxin
MTYVWVAVAAFAVGILFYSFQAGRQAVTTAGEGYVVGDPGPGEQAPDFRLQASNGETVELADYEGKSVLLYFQEGIGCQPCWDQIRDLEQQAVAVEAAGVDEILSITTSPLDLVTRKVKDDGLSTPVAADPDLKVSEAYDANKYGMMGSMANGHSFVLVGPDGTIDWRADYGGEPRYTMYLPVDKLLADLAEGTKANS